MSRNPESRRRRLPSAAAWIGWTVLVGVWSVAIARALTAELPAAGPPLGPSAERAVFRALQQAEPSMRARTARNFPRDAWSQDDDFHAGELQMAQRLARQHGVSVGEILRVWDSGLREGWEPGANETMRVTVPPCRPRPVY